MVIKNPPSPPLCVVDKRKRDLTKAKIKRIENLNLISNDILLAIGIQCVKLHGRLVRKDYDILTKQMGGLSYIPTRRRFGNWDGFKKSVFDKLMLLDS